MFYTKSFIANYEKSQALAIRDDLIEKVSKVVKVNTDSQRYDLSLILPTGQTCHVCLILSDIPWVDYYVPVYVLKAVGVPLPNLFWFAEVRDGVVTNINSIKLSVVNHFAVDVHKPDNKIVDDKMNVRFTAPTSPSIAWNLAEQKGFNMDPVKTFTLEGDVLLDDRIRFSHLDFDPKLQTVDDGFWFLIHVSAALQGGIYANYSTLWTRFQEYLAR